MQTFLPYKNFNKTARCLDYRRLGKQRVEAWQIYQAINGQSGWRNHPIVKMWSKYKNALLIYGMTMCIEWSNRGYEDNMYSRFHHELMRNLEICKERVEFPKWMYKNKFIRSHRSNLLRKNKEYYSKFKWVVPDNLPYYWERS